MVLEQDKKVVGVKRHRPRGWGCVVCRVADRIRPSCIRKVFDSFEFILKPVLFSPHRSI
jgi:hypothetical protein